MKKIISVYILIFTFVFISYISVYAEDTTHIHIPSEEVQENIIEPACETSGSYSLVTRCKDCGEVISSETVITAPLGHDEVTDKAVKATYTSLGKTEGSHCSRCNLVFVSQKDIPMLRLSKVKGLAVKLKSYDGIRMDWDKVKGATGYYVMYRKGSSGSWVKKRTSKLSYGLAGLKEGYSYQFKVMAYAKNGKGVIVNKGEDSSIKTLRTLRKMSSPRVSKLSAKSARVKWQSIKGASGYQVCVTAKSNSRSVKACTKKLSLKISPLTKGNRYSFKVRAYRLVDGKKIFAPWSKSVIYRAK